MSDAQAAAADRLYTLLPAHIRSIDAAGGSPLYGFLHALATGSVALDAEITRLFDNLFVETADGFGLDNLARLVGAEPLQALPVEAQFSPRAFIANTVRHRRRKGTPQALEDLAGDLGGHGPTVVEYYQRLVRTAALIDPRPERPGTAPVTDGDTGAHIGGAFDRSPRLADVRSIARAGGRHGVPNVGVHLVRLGAPAFPAVAVATPTPVELAGVPVMLPWPSTAGTARPGYFQLSPFFGGRVPLVNPDRRDQLDGARMDDARRIDRLRRLPIDRAVEARRLALAQGKPQSEPVSGDFFDDQGQPFTLYVRYSNATGFVRVPPERLLIANLETAPVGNPRPAATRTYKWAEPGAIDPQTKTGNVPIVAAFDPATARVVIAAPVTPADEVTEVRLAHAYGVGDEIGAGAHDRPADDMPADVSTTDFLRIVDPFGTASATVATLALAIADWMADPAATRGFILCTRCDAESALADFTLKLRPGTELHIVAAGWSEKIAKPGVSDLGTRRGYIVRAGRRFVINAPLKIYAAAPPPIGSAPGVLVLDGLVLTGGVSVGANALSSLRLRHVSARAVDKPAIVLSAASTGFRLILERSVTGALALAKGSGTLHITRSIVSGSKTLKAIDADAFETALDDVTLFGKVRVRRLDATGTIFTDAVTAIDRQIGCVRYSAIARGSSTPHRFRCQPDLAIATRARLLKLDALPAAQADAIATGVTPIFLDTDPDEPTFGLLSSRCAVEIRSGGENGKEMGAFGATGEPMRFANITRLFADYLPAALEGAIIDDTRNRASALRRNVP